MRDVSCIALGLAAVALSGCSFTVGQLASVTPETAETRPLPASEQRVRGRDCIPIVVLAPLWFPSLDRAAADALGEGGTTLTDVVIRFELRYALFGLACYVIEGIPS